MEKNKQGKYKRTSAYYKGVRFVHRNYAAIGTTGGIIAFYILVRGLPNIVFVGRVGLSSYSMEPPGIIKLPVGEGKPKRTYGVWFHGKPSSPSLTNKVVVYFHGNAETAWVQQIKQYLTAQALY
jgi:hypothetical protein